MDDRRLVARLMGLTVSVAQAKRTFPATPPCLFFEAAPPGDRGRLLTFGEAFRIARRHAEETAAEARATRAAAAKAADAEAARAACAAPALAHLASVIEAELSGLVASLRARSASPRAIQTLDLIAGRCGRQIGWARSRLDRKGARNVPA